VITIDELVSSSMKPGNWSLGLRLAGGTRLAFVPGTLTSFGCANANELGFANEIVETVKRRERKGIFSWRLSEEEKNHR
jgi:hypothetical protein